MGSREVKLLASLDLAVYDIKKNIVFLDFNESEY